MRYEKELDVALDAVQKASRLCAGVQFDLVSTDTLQKKDRSPVTIADYGSQAIISSILQETFPDDPLVGEEDIKALQDNAEMRDKIWQLVQSEAPQMSSDQMLEAINRGNAEPNYSARYWTVDPIDGTKGFLRKEQYAVALALVEHGQVKLGVLGCPNLPVDIEDPQSEIGCLFFALQGQGAYTSTLDNADRKQIHVSSLEDSANARFVESVESAHSAHSVHAEISNVLHITREPLRIDSQCKYATVGRGDVAIYLRYPKDDVYREKIWDHAAGMIVVQEAGGKVTDIFGKPLDFSLGRKLVNNQGVVATNGVVHDQIIQTISQL